MPKALAVIGTGFLLIFFAPLFGVLLGAFSGFIVGMFFDDTIVGFLSRLGLDTTGLAMWQVGASLGFIGSFFRTAVTK